jgi:general secretion pathway protein C
VERAGSLARILLLPLSWSVSALAATDSQPVRADLTRLLGATPVAADPAQDDSAAVSSRLRLVGVVAPKSDRAARAGEGVALIEVDGVVRTVRVGAKVDGELRLLRVDARSASLGVDAQAPAQVLQMQAQPVAATGNLPPAAPSATVLGGEASAGDQSAPAPGAPTRQRNPTQ